MKNISSNNPADYLLKYPNTVGVGIGPKFKRGDVYSEHSVVVMVSKKLPLSMLSPEDVIPQSFGGMLTDVMEVGEIKALQARTDEWRPAPGGVSIGHYAITAGTLGAIVRTRDTKERMILSNNHVLANSNDAEIGDPIFQPGPYDMYHMETPAFARLEAFVPIQFGVAPPSCDLAKGVANIANWFAQIVGSSHRLIPMYVNSEVGNVVDAAIARPISDDLIRDDILEVGNVVMRTNAVLGMEVKKSGRTTGLTTGTVKVLGATINVGYGEDKVAVFEDQIVTNGMSEPGDSGSLLVDMDNRAVGLLFAGSDQATIHSPIDKVCDLLGVDFYA